MPLLNLYGKPWDESDALHLAVAANAVAGNLSYSVTSVDGVPLLGKLHDGDTRPITLVAKDWAMREHGPRQINPLTNRPYNDA